MGNFSQQPEFATEFEAHTFSTNPVTAVKLNQKAVYVGADGDITFCPAGKNNRVIANWVRFKAVKAGSFLPVIVDYIHPDAEGTLSGGSLADDANIFARLTTASQTASGTGHVEYTAGATTSVACEIVDSDGEVIATQNVEFVVDSSTPPAITAATIDGASTVFVSTSDKIKVPANSLSSSHDSFTTNAFVAGNLTAPTLPTTATDIVTFS